MNKIEHCVLSEYWFGSIIVINTILPIIIYIFFQHLWDDIYFNLFSTINVECARSSRNSILFLSSVNYLVVVSVAVFQICIQNRYKLTKKYRKLKESLTSEGCEDVEARSMLAAAKVGRKSLTTSVLNLKRNLSSRM